MLNAVGNIAKQFLNTVRDSVKNFYHCRQYRLKILSAVVDIPKIIVTLSPTALKKFSFQSQQKQIFNTEKIQNSKKLLRPVK
jgi:hypothetical protein